MKFKLTSFFAGAGGMDIGFTNAGFQVVWANEFDKDIWETYQHGHPHVHLDKRSIFDIQTSQIPDSDGIIGGPPCQSWSAAGKNLGSQDIRGQAFFEFIRVLTEKQPKFFVIENVEGITRKTHDDAFDQILNSLESAGYHIHHKVLNAADYGVPQDRKRLFIVGFRKNLTLKKTFKFPEVSSVRCTLKDAIYDLMSSAVPTTTYRTSDANCHLVAGWSSNFMSRNRVREWNEQSFTVPASSRHVTIHPQAPKMVNVGKDKFAFAPGFEHLYRRFTINELSRIQTFPDNYFKFNNINTAHKMVGNAVPCKLAEAVAKSILDVLPSNSITKIIIKKKMEASC